MGALCGKQSNESEPFSQPGRTVGSAPSRQSSPHAAVPKISRQGHTLGGSGGGERSDAREAAARAAEERAKKANQPKGKLGKGLARERAQTRTGTLENVSKDERRRRDADQSTEARNYN
ncbi:hypothetical protein MMC28_010310 [Mycoblastus sanguinarius]|nr:hypothetical protein [Mycoblastus sanguinarius]